MNGDGFPGFQAASGGGEKRLPGSPGQGRTSLESAKSAGAIHGRFAVSQLIIKPGIQAAKPVLFRQ